METRFCEVTNGIQNWGKFMLARFTAEEFAYESAVDIGRSLLGAMPISRKAGGPAGWTPMTTWILDLQTREGVAFDLRGDAVADLNLHKVWVCPLFEPFLVWLYAHPDICRDLSKLPAHVDIPDADFLIAGHRRPGRAQ